MKSLSASGAGVHCLWPALLSKGVCTAFGLYAIAALAEVGKDWGVERQSYRDPVTGINICELTRGPSASDNLYFHFSNFTADNRYVIFVSDRTGWWQIYRVNVDTGQIIQLTDSAGVQARTACPDPANARRLFYLKGAEVVALDFLDFTSRKVGDIPPPYVGGFEQPSLSEDGKRLTLAKQRDATTWEIGLMEIETGQYRTVITQGFRIGHVQHSPKAALIFYVWETGGYAPQRSWLVNADGSGNRPFYVRTDPKAWFTPLKEWVTHEAWISGTGEMTMIIDKLGVMIVGPEGTSRVVSEGHYWHGAGRPDGRVLVLDDAEGRLWLVETATGNRRLLATETRRQVRSVHPHASFDRLGRYVQFHSGHSHETVALIDLSQPLPASGAGTQPAWWAPPTLPR